MSETGSSFSEIRGVLLPLQQHQLLLPNAAVAEVTNFQPVDGDVVKPQDGMLGMVDWRQQKIPLVAFEGLNGIEAGVRIGHRARIAICNTLQGDGNLRFIGLLCAGIPRLVRVTTDNVSSAEDSEALPPMVLQRVLINDESAWIPDLDALQDAVETRLG